MSDYLNGEVKIIASTVAHASADKVWRIVGALDGLENIIPNQIAKVSLSSKPKTGAVRVCEFPEENGGGFVKEEIIDYNNEQKYYRYRVTDGTIPVKNLENIGKVVSVGGNRSQIIWASSYNFIENEYMSEEQFGDFLKQGLQEWVDNLAKAASN